MIRRSLPLLLLLSTACSGPEPRGGDGVAPVGTSLTPSPAVAAALAASLEHERGGALPDGVAVRRIGRLARDLAKASDVRLASVTLTAGGDAALHLLPGRRLQVARGLIARLAVETKSQPHLAALLAHGVAHLGLGHVDARLAAGLRAARVEALPGKIKPFLDGTASPAAGAAIGQALEQLRGLRFDPEACAAAERLAVRSLAKLGYPASTAREAWEHLAAAEAAEGAAPFAAWVGAHGPLGRRARAAALAARELGRQPARSAPALRVDLRSVQRDAQDAEVARAAERLARQDRWPTAARILDHDASAAKSPLGARARARIGIQTQEWVAAERALRALLLRWPSDHTARLLLAESYVAQGNPQAAREELTALLKRAPFLAAAHLLRARVEDDAARKRAWLRLARALDVREGPVARAASAALSDDPDGATPPGRKDPKRTRILSGG